MQKSCSRSLLALMILSLSYPLLQTGCQSHHGRVLKVEPSSDKASTVTSIKIQRQNLSMAQKLRNRPPTEYILGPEDTVEISVLGHEEMRMEVTVGPTGKIPYYFMDEVQAGGLTQFQLKQRIQEKLSEYIKDPKVVVRITGHGSHKVFVLGQVKNPGVYRMKSDITLLEAISSAGGITPDAYLSGAYLVRDGKILLVNFLDLIKRGNTRENVPLAPDDIIYIPDENDHKVYVLGEVTRQSAIPIQERLTLMEAITEAGGFTWDANKKSILVLRGNLSEPEIMIIDAKRIFKERDLVANIPLRTGDIVYVPSSFLANVERFAVRLSNILDPLLKIERGIILHDAAVEVFTGEDEEKRRIVITD